MTRSLFASDILRRLLLRVSPAKPTSAALRFRSLRRTKSQFRSPQHPWPLERPRGAGGVRQTTSALQIFQLVLLPPLLPREPRGYDRLAAYSARLIGGGFQRPSSASGLGAYRRIVFLHWLLNVYKVPAELSDARYGVRYTNPTYAAELAATTVEAADIEVKEIVGIGVFTNLTGPDELNETGPLTVGEVIDRVIHPSRSPVASRARRHPNIFYNDNNTRLGNLLSKWAGEPEKTKFYDYSAFRHHTPPRTGRKEPLLVPPGTRCGNQAPIGGKRGGDAGRRRGLAIFDQPATNPRFNPLRGKTRVSGLFFLILREKNK